MNATPQRLLIVAAAVACALTVFAQGGANSVVVDGKTVSRTDQAVTGIKVQAVRDSTVIAEAVSGSGGQYELHLPSGVPFDLVFVAPAWNESVFLNLSGKEKHHIVKVMVKVGEPLSIQEAAFKRVAAEYIKLLKR